MTDYTLTTHNLTRRFGKLIAVEALTLTVPQGAVYGFLGPNGAGKTTTIRLALGLIRPTGGDVALFGQPLRRDRRALLRRVGALVEGPSLYPHLTGRENLEVTRRLIDATPAQRDRALHLVQLADAADRAVKTYSMGMKQRLALALALLGEPELLILDEPTNGLDPAGIREIRELICTLPQEYGITVFLSSHLLTEIEQVATHIGIIRQGRLIFEGALDALHAQSEQHLVVEVDKPQWAKDVLHTQGWNVRGNGNHRITLAVNGAADVARINMQLVQSGVSIYHLHLQQPTLEDIFLSVTEA